MTLKLSIFLSHLTIMLLLVSCEQDVFTDTLDVKEVTITTSHQRGNSKATLDNISFSWNKEDKLAIFNSKTSNAQFTASKDGQAVMFTGALNPVNQEYLYAVYPYNENATIDGGKYKFNMPTLQKQSYLDGVVDLSSIGNYLFSFGQTSTAWSDADNINLKMEHLMTIFDIEVSGIAAGADVSKFVLTTNDGAGFASEASVSFVQAEDTTPSYELSVTKSNQIEVELIDAVVSSGEPFIVRVAAFPYAFSESAIWNVSVDGDASSWKGEKSFAYSVTTNPGAKYTVKVDVQKHNPISHIFHGNVKSCIAKSENHTMTLLFLEHLNRGEFKIEYETGGFAKKSDMQVGQMNLYTIELEKNDTGKDRTTRVSFTTKDGLITEFFTIHQVAVDKIVATCSTMSIDNSAQSITIDIDANVPWQATPEVKEWAGEVQQPSRPPFTIGKSISFNISANDYSARIIIINFKSAGSSINNLSTITINQSGVEPSSTTYRMPIVLHMLYSSGDKPLLTEAQVQNVLYNTNKLANQGEGLDLHFELAKDDTTGELLEENGVNYIDMGQSNSEFDPYAVLLDKFDNVNGITAPIKPEYYDVNKYINVFVFKFNMPLAGLSNFPYVKKSNPLVGMVSSEYYLTHEMTKPHGLCLNYDSGFTAGTFTHELGHYFGLFHTFYTNKLSEKEKLLNDHCDDTYTYNRDEYSFTYERYDNFKNITYVSENIMDYYYNYDLEFTQNQKARIEHIVKYGVCVPNSYQTTTRATYNSSEKPPLVKMPE